MLIKVDGLSCGYDKKEVLSNLSFEIGEGELWCVLGSNGIGKSTLFKTLLGLLKPIRGEILIKDKPLPEWSRKELAKVIAYVPQSHTPPFPFKVREIVAMGRHPYQGQTGYMTDEDISRVEEAMEMTGITDLAERPYTRISGGERQLALIARAVAQSTDVMILDEPVSNLDFGNHAKVISYIREFAGMGKTIIMTTHDPDHAFIPGSHALLLDEGAVFASGMGRDILTEPAVTRMYHVKNKIVRYGEPEGRTCVPLYEGRNKSDQ